MIDVDENLIEDYNNGQPLDWEARYKKAMGKE